MEGLIFGTLRYVFFIFPVTASYFSVRFFICMTDIHPFLSHASSYAQKDREIIPSKCISV